MNAPTDTLPRIDAARPIFPLAAEWRQYLSGGGERRIPVAILSIADDAAVVLDQWNRLVTVTLWQLRIIEPTQHPAMQALLRAHVALSNGGAA